MWWGGGGGISQVQEFFRLKCPLMQEHFFQAIRCVFILFSQFLYLAESPPPPITILMVHPLGAYKCKRFCMGKITLAQVTASDDNSF